MPVNISLQHRRPSDRNNRSLSNTCVCNNRRPSDRRLIYSIEVSIRDLRVISGMWKTPVDWHTTRQRASYRRITKSVDISRRTDRFPQRGKRPASSSRLVITHGIHRPDIRCIDHEDDDADAGRCVSTRVAPVEFTSAISCAGIASYFN